MKTQKKTARKGKREARPEFTATMPKGLSPAAQVAWEAAAVQSGGSWSPQAQGEGLIGKLVSATEESGKYGTQRVLHFSDAEVIDAAGKVQQVGQTKVYCSTILESEYQRIQPKVGDQLLVLFKGHYSTGRGRPARLFAMSVVKSSSSKKGRG